MGNRSYPGTVLGDVVGAAAWGSKIYTLRGGLDGCEQMCTLYVVFVLGVCLRETWVVFRDDPQYNVMKYLVFGTISVVYYQSYKLLFLNPIAMVYT
jgi:hypothetical protein